MSTDEQVAQAEGNAPTTTPEQAEQWLDSAIGELEGALLEAGRHVEAGTLELDLVSAKVQGLYLRMMTAAQRAEQAAQGAEVNG